ncbi:MAG: AAA family ATPase [Candidatus Marinimicrobia bacterium]|jgi:hypothetical protein|nr:AAA family ATPase [Candidatus Omnitrophota bacterium]MDD5061819.1 AAA family ATPase [Candidatus Neomarinimicrobiota bacterium]MDD5230195.1 AAA family ATPase [Candidatus Neomarinimicrobiota bacterium]MDD5540415.1 AAA family ATPase [Candidatus Neomarinimicrobiota bacterium]
MSIRDDLKKLLIDSKSNGKEITIANLARAIGCDRSNLSKYIAGKYKGNTGNFEAKIANYLSNFHNQDKLIESEIITDIINNNDNENDYTTSAEFVETKISKTIFEIAEMVNIEKEIGIITGRAGIGKTFSIKEYARNHSNVIIIEADLTYTAKVMVREICARLGIISGLGLHEMFEELVYKLDGSDMVLFIDEVEHLPVRAIDVLRRIHDRTGCGVLICGLPQLLTRMKSLRGDYAYIFSRIGIGARLDAPNRKDVCAIVHSMMDNADEKICESFYEHSAGSIRILVKLIRRSIRVARINDMPVNREIIAESAKLLTL